MIGIIGAMELEVDYFKELIEEKSIETVSGIEFVRGLLCQNEAVIACCGIGKVNSALCAQTMILKYSPDIIINTGVGGSLSEKLNIGDIVIGEYAVQTDYDLSPIGFDTGFIPEIERARIECSENTVKKIKEAAERLGLSYQTGIIATSDAFISGNEKKKYLAQMFDAIACEMEGGSIAQVCFLNKVDCAIIRAISDNADGSSEVDFSKFAKMAAENSVKLICEFLK